MASNSGYCTRNGSGTFTLERFRMLFLTLGWSIVSGVAWCRTVAEFIEQRDKDWIGSQVDLAA